MTDLLRKRAALCFKHWHPGSACHLYSG